MKRITLWFLATAVSLVLLFSYHTSTSGPAGAHNAAGVAPAGVVAESPGPLTATAAPSPTTAAASKAPSAAAGPSGPAAVAPTTAPRVVATPAQPKPSPTPNKTAATTRTINGVAVDTRYGPVQVQIKVSGNRIVSSNAIVYPTNERRDREINDYAVPRLNDETLKAQSSTIDTVSGATYTSDGYRQSLQSAIDASHR